MWCSNCGMLLPGEARFCLTCGTPQDARDVGAGGPTPPRPAASIAEYEPAVCETSLWRGYVKARFVGVVRDGDDIYEAGRSPGFRCGRDAPSEDDPRALAAFDALLEVLAAAAWEPVAGGRPWYAYRFRRRVQDVPYEPAPAAAPRVTSMGTEGDEEIDGDRPPRPPQPLA